MFSFIASERSFLEDCYTFGYCETLISSNSSFRGTYFKKYKKLMHNIQYEDKYKIFDHIEQILGHLKYN